MNNKHNSQTDRRGAAFGRGLALIALGLGIALSHAAVAAEGGSATDQAALGMLDRTVLPVPGAKAANNHGT